MIKKRFALASALGLFVCALTTGCASQPAIQESTRTTFKIPGSVARAAQRPVDDWVPGVENFAVISSDVWRGAKPTAEGFRMLASAGVKTVIDLREDDESAEVPEGIRYVRLPVSSWQADRVDVAEVLRVIKDSPKPVFIHCRQGRDRTGLAVAAYRLSQGMTAAEACEELHNFHVNVWWSGPIEERVHELAHSLHPAIRTEAALLSG